jgi:hypothetical protein
MDRIKINTLLHSLYNKMNKREKENFEKYLILQNKLVTELSKELLTKIK